MKTLIIIPFFNSMPKWVNLFFESCRLNSNFNWLFLTNIDMTPYYVPKNVKVVNIGWRDCVSLVSRKLKFGFDPCGSYKLCDVRFAYAHIFSEYIDGYDFWGFGDIDLLYSDFNKTLPAFDNYDLVTFTDLHPNGQNVSGPLSFIRNTEENNSCYLQCPNWKEVATRRGFVGIDEKGHYPFKRVYRKEAYATPLLTCVPWVDGSFTFPKVWYWKDGRITTNTTGEREFIYFHFMQWKKHWANQKTYIDVGSGRSKYGWKISYNGFIQCKENEPIEAGTAPPFLD